MTAAEDLDGLAKNLLARLDRGTPANVALMHMLIEALAPEAVDAGLERARSRLDAGSELAAKLDAVGEQWRGAPGAWTLVNGVARSVAHEPDTGAPDQTLRYWRETFDRLADHSPEAGVALYALGRPELLEAATAEVVDRLRAWGLLGADRDVLDLGCGIGRFSAALAPHVRSVLALDLSAKMVVEARRRCRGFPNVRVSTSSGQDLAQAGAAAFDLLLAADVFPYLVQAGPEALDAHFREAGRVLRPGASLLILNFSYRGDAGRDRADVEDLAAAHGLRVVRLGTRDLQLWDAMTFQLVKA